MSGVMAIFRAPGCGQRERAAPAGTALLALETGRAPRQLPAPVAALGAAFAQLAVDPDAERLDASLEVLPLAEGQAVPRPAADPDLARPHVGREPVGLAARQEAALHAGGDPLVDLAELGLEPAAA